MSDICPRCGTPGRGARTCSWCGLKFDAVDHATATGDASWALLSAPERPSGGVITAPELPGFAPPAPRVATAPSYVTGGLVRRFFAQLIDATVCIAASLGLGLVLALAGAPYSQAADACWIVFLLASVLYAPVLITMNDGRTWGKQAAGVRVIRSDGRRVGFGRALVREVVVKGMFGAIGVGTVVDWLVALCSHERRSLHDLLCDTRVVRG